MRVAQNRKIAQVCTKKIFCGLNPLPTKFSQSKLCRLHKDKFANVGLHKIDLLGMNPLPIKFSRSKLCRLHKYKFGHTGLHEKDFLGMNPLSTKFSRSNLCKMTKAPVSYLFIIRDDLQALFLFPKNLESK